MPIQLRLLDDEGKPRRDLIWPTLSEQVQRHVQELFAHLLVAVVTDTSTTEPGDESSLEDHDDTSAS